MNILNVEIPDVIHYIHHNMQKCVIGLGAIIALAGGAYAYVGYQKGQNQLAQKVYATCIYELQKAQYDATLWPSADLAVQTAYYQYGSTSYAPYFLLLRAHILVQQGKYDEAIPLFQEGMAKLSATSPLYHEYALSAALAKIDSSQKELQEKGVHELEKLAYDLHNLQRDHALYELGYYYTTHNEQQKADEVWSQLMTDYGTAQDFGASPWVELARQKVVEHAG